ncbi:MAG TPA: magnesium transporter [Candidatus Kapabacteria bacterium]|nr:magnesium transporter [Candidatus Kapabacteria bacterium]
MASQPAGQTARTGATPRATEGIAGHLRTGIARLRAGDTVAQALAGIRADPPSGRIIYLYVTDHDGKLCGVVPTRRLLLSPPDAHVSEILVADVITLPQTATLADAFRLFARHHLLALPVVDPDGVLLGVVDVELYTSELGAIEESRRADDLFQLIGVHLAATERPSAFGAFRSRFPWLLCNVAGGLGAAFLSGLFAADMERAVALALFIPIVLALSESVSIQSVSISLTLLQGRRPGLPELVSRLRAEVGTGLLLGGATAALVAAVAWLWTGHAGVVVALLGGIAAGVTCAAAIGLLMPMLLRLLKRDPHVAAGPIALAAADMTTLLIYFNIATVTT